MRDIVVDNVFLALVALVPSDFDGVVEIALDSVGHRELLEVLDVVEVKPKSCLSYL